MEVIINAFNAFLAIIFIVFVPPFLSCVTVIECTRRMIKGEPEYRNWLKDRELVKYVLSLHPNKGLSAQGLFWLAILTPFFYFVILGAFAWNGYVLRFDAEGYKTFISISALPLGVLSLALPLSVSVARFHSSKQTARQIEIVSQKNNVDLFHSHRKELFSYFTQVGETEYSKTLTGKSHVHPRIHKLFFMGSPEKGAPIPNEEMFSEIKKDIFSLFNLLDAVINNVNKELTFDFYIANFCPQLYSTALKLGLIDIILAFKNTSIESIEDAEGNKYRTVGQCTEDSITSMKYIFNFYNNLCDFAGYPSSQKDLLKDYSHLILNDSYKKNKIQIIDEIIGSLNSDKYRGLKQNTKIVFS